MVDNKSNPCDKYNALAGARPYPNVEEDCRECRGETHESAITCTDGYGFDACMKIKNSIHMICGFVADK